MIRPGKAVLTRPDGHVAWAGDRSDPGLLDALTAWFGRPPRGGYDGGNVTSGDVLSHVGSTV